MLFWGIVGCYSGCLNRGVDKVNIGKMQIYKYFYIYTKIIEITLKKYITTSLTMFLCILIYRMNVYKFVFIMLRAGNMFLMSWVCVYFSFKGIKSKCNIIYHKTRYIVIMTEYINCSRCHMNFINDEEHIKNDFGYNRLY